MGRAKKEPLPEPAFVPFPARCPGCAYDLAGAERLTRCPECATPIAVGAPCLVIACIPQRKAGPAWRRWAWVVIATAFVILSQTWFYILIWQPLMLGAILLACTIAAVFMVMSGSSASTSTERVHFSTSGMIRTIWGTGQSTFHPWAGTETCRGQRIGPFWQRLRILGDGHRRIFECGFRCRSESLGAVAATIERYARGEQPDRDTLRGLIDDRTSPRA